MENLDDFLNSNEAPEAEVETEVTETPEEVETPEAKAERERDEKGRFKAKGEEEAAPPAAEEKTAPVAALQDERRKRQELAAELEQLRAQLAQQAQQPPQPPVDMFEDPDGWQQQFGTGLVQTAVNEATMRTRLEMSEMMARQAHPDFEEKAQKWLGLVQTTPGLRERGLSNAHPWDFALKYVANHDRMEALAATDVTDLEAKLREQIKAELAAETSAAPQSPQVPETLADAQSARGAAPAGTKPPSFEEILGRK